ncbi:MAG: hypothetical protein ACTSXW_02970 [Candidatus Baldrarchaeia archaeon]
MHLRDMAKEAIEILQKAGEEGCLVLELAYKLGVSRRRIYDIVAVLKAADLITTKREKHGTRIIWKTELHYMKEKNMLLEIVKKERTLRKLIERKLLELREKKTWAREEEKKEKEPSQIPEMVKFNVTKLRIRSDGGYLKVSNKGIEATVESTYPSIIVEPIKVYTSPRKTRPLKGPQGI